MNEQINEMVMDTAKEAFNPTEVAMNFVKGLEPKSLLVGALAGTVIYVTGEKVHKSGVLKKIPFFKKKTMEVTVVTSTEDEDNFMEVDLGDEETVTEETEE